VALQFLSKKKTPTTPCPPPDVTKPTKHTQTQPTHQKIDPLTKSQ